MVEAGQRLSAMPVDYVIVTEESFRHFFRLRSSRYARHRHFYAELFDLRRFEPIARFETPTRILGIDVPRRFLPEDLVLVAPVTYVFRRVGSQPSSPTAGETVACRTGPARGIPRRGPPS
jgi:hypothetical protein